MRLTPAILLLSIILPVGAAAQPVPDTLDWHRYFPLEVGNEWHYRDAEAFPVTRLAIIGDTLIEDRVYFQATESVFELFFDSSAPTLVQERDLLLSYDDSGIVAEFDGTESIGDVVPTVFERGSAEFPHTDLRSSFGVSIDTEIDVTGNFAATIRIGDHQLIVPAVKQFVQQAWQWSFAADIGFLGGGNLHGPVLEYARVGGVEYGSIVVRSESSPRAVRKSGRALFFFPNPAQDVVNLAFEAASHHALRLEFFDLTGKRVAVYDLTDARSAGRVIDRIDISRLIPGSYLARVRTGKQVIAGGSLIVWR